MLSHKARVLPAERLERLREYILVEPLNVVDLNSLATQFRVSAQTIRRDLDQLAVEGLVERTFGGARVLRNSITEEPEMAARESSGAEAKYRIAKFALESILPGQSIFFDASTSVMSLIRLLPDGIKLSATTHSLIGAQMLASKIDGPVLLLGGEYRATADCVGGIATLDQLRGLGFNQALVSCRTLNLTQGFAEALEVEAALKRVIFAGTEQMTVLADSTKFGQISAHGFGELDSVDRLIMEDGEWIERWPTLQRDVPNLVLAP